MFVQLDIHYYVGFPSFRDLPYIYMVSSTEPDKTVKCLLFTLVAVLVVLTDSIRSINRSSFIFFSFFKNFFSFFLLLFFLLLTGLKVLAFRNIKSGCKLTCKS